MVRGMKEELNKLDDPTKAFENILRKKKDENFTAFINL